MCVVVWSYQLSEIHHMESSKIDIEKFDGSDFGFWKMQLQDSQYQKDLQEPLSEMKADTMTTK